MSAHRDDHVAASQDGVVASTQIQREPVAKKHRGRSCAEMRPDNGQGCHRMVSWSSAGDNRPCSILDSTVIF